jgi:hypothetical protein
MADCAAVSLLIITPSPPRYRYDSKLYSTIDQAKFLADSYQVVSSFCGNARVYVMSAGHRVPLGGGGCV